MTFDEPTCDLNKILKHAYNLNHIKKCQSEVVITRYDETLEWTKGFGHLCTVYNKGNTPVPSHISACYRVPNYGLGSESMLRHIILHYNNLADMTFFCQGRIADRSDQPLYPINWYIDDPHPSEIHANSIGAYDRPDSRFFHMFTKESCRAVDERTLARFRDEIVGIPYKLGHEYWVPGDWIAVGKDKIMSKPLDYYIWLYLKCQFERGIYVEELWYLERAWYCIFTKYLKPKFKYTVDEDEKKRLLVRLLESMRL